MMKKYLLASLALMMALVACKRESDQLPPEDIDPLTDPSAVLFQAKMPRISLKTKSEIGALENKWHPKQDLYVYGIARQGEDAQAPVSAPLDLTDETGRFIDNKLITLPEDFDYDIITPQDVKVYRVLPDGESLGIPYFYDDEHRRYEFFGYYADDAWLGLVEKMRTYDNVTDSLTDNGNFVPVPVIDEGGVSLPVKINGSQDLLLAHTSKELDNETAKLNVGRLYSGYSARRGVIPNLIFEHQLARFNVYVRVGDELADRLTLSTLAIETYTEGTMHIANVDQYNNPPALEVNREGERTFLGVWDGTFGAALKQLDNSIKAEGSRYQLPLVTRSGWVDTEVGTIMVMPGESAYKIRVGLKQAGYKDGQEFQNDYIFSFDDLLLPSQDPKGPSGVPDPEVLDIKAEPGHQYDLNVVVYGIQQMQITASLSEWAEGGRFVVDEDKEVDIHLGLDVPGDPKYLKGTKDNPIDLDLTDSESYALNATTQPKDREIHYSSYRNEIAMVSQDGIITPISRGKTYLSLSVDPFTNYPYGGYRRVWVQVTGEAPTDRLIVTAPEKVDMTIGQPSIDLEHTVTCDGEPVEGVTWTFSSSDESVVFVDEAGHLTAMSEGDATIIVKAHKYAYIDGLAAVEVHVTRPWLEISLPDGDEMNIRVGGDKGKINWSIKDNLGRPVPEDAYILEFVSSDPTIAAVDEEGVVTPVSHGAITVTLTATITDAYRSQYFGSSVVVKVNVAKQPQVVINLRDGTATAIVATYGDEPFDLNELGLVTTEPEGATIGWGMPLNNGVATLNGSVVTILGTGDTDITVSATMDTYLPAIQKNIHLTVQRANTQIQVEPEFTLQWTSPDEPPSAMLNASVPGGGTITYFVTEGGEYLTVYSNGWMVAQVNEDVTATVTVYASSSENYNGTKTEVLVHIKAYREPGDEPDPGEEPGGDEPGGDEPGGEDPGEEPETPGNEEENN